VNIILGVTGGIASYKAADLTSKLVGLGHSVRVVMTPSATGFIQPLTFEALTGHPVLLDGHLDAASSATGAMAHIDWPRWADCAVIAPLTASTMGKLAHGIADNALLTLWLALASDVPQLLCPAMNPTMWSHPAVQRNILEIKAWERVHWCGPIDKRVACGETGVGGLEEVPRIVAHVQTLIERG